MKIMLAAALGLAVLAVPAAAEKRYDRKIEQAAIQIVVKKLGDLRGGFSFDADLVRIMLPDLGSTASLPVKSRLEGVSRTDSVERTDGLALAVERTPISITF